MQLAQAVARLEAELLAEQSPALVVSVERLRPAPRAIQREHQLSAQPFAQRVAPHQRVELWHELGVTPQREVDLDPRLERPKPGVVELACYRRGKGLVLEVGERPASPEAEPLAHRFGSLLGFTLLEQSPAFGDQELETAQVELVILDEEHVARRLRDEQLRVAAVVGLEQLAQPGHVRLQRRLGICGRRLAPELLDEPVARDDLSRAQEKQGEQCFLLRSSQA